MGIQKRITRTAATGLVALVVGGCEAIRKDFEMNFGPTSRDYNQASTAPGAEAAVAGTLLGALGAQKNNPAAIVTGQGLVRYGTAQAGKTEVHVYPQPFPQQPTPSLVKASDEKTIISHGGVFTVCNSIHDFENDGMIDYPKDYIGLKGSFSQQERITVSAIFDGVVDNIKYKLINEKDRVHSMRWSLEGDCGLRVVYEPKDLSPGIYRSIWYQQDKLLEQITFEVQK